MRAKPIHLSKFLQNDQQITLKKLPWKKGRSLITFLPVFEEKRAGGNVYEELARILLCDVTIIYVSYINKLCFPRKCVCNRVLSQTKIS